eukprot:scaffold2960_cov61-Phaeocystis_antarctica.AAC.8
MVTPITSSAVQVHEPRRWPRNLSSMRWTSTRPTRPSVEITTMLSRRHRSSGAKNAVQPMRARLRAIRKAWNGKAIRKSCAAQTDSCEGSAKAPVMGCIAMLAAAAAIGAAASRSGHGSGSCSLRGASLASRSMVPRGLPIVVLILQPVTAPLLVNVALSSRQLNTKHRGETRGGGGKGCAACVFRQDVLHPPPPFRKVGSGSARGAVCLHVVHPGPGLLQQHGVQCSDGASLHAGSPKSQPQRADDSVHMDLVFRDQNVPASDQQGLLWCRHTVGSRGWYDCRSCHATACRPGYAGALTLVTGLTSRTE